MEFHEKTSSGNFFRNFVQTKTILYKNLSNFALLFLILLWVSIRLKKLTQVTLYVVCTQVRRHVHKKITKRRYGEEKRGRFVFGKPVLCTLGLEPTTPYSLGILIWNLYQTFVIVPTEFWLRFEPQIRPTRFEINFLLITARAERKVRLCVKLFDFFPRWILTHLTWNPSRFVQNSVEILTWNFTKKLVREIFLEILCKPRLSSTKTCEISSYFLRFYFVSILCVKFTQVPPYVVYTQARRHVHKKITKGRYGEEQPGRFVFRKPVLCILSLEPTTPYSLGILIWNFYPTFIIVPTEFWMRFEPQIRPTRFAINILLITARAEKEGSYVCETVWFYFLGEYSPVWPEIYRVLSQFQSRLLHGISRKNILRDLFRNFVETKAILYQNLWNVALLSAILFWVHIALKKFTQVPPYVVCTQVRRHVHKQITKGRYGEEKPWRFVFGIPV